MEVKNKPCVINIIMSLIPWKHPRGIETIVILDGREDRRYTNKYQREKRTGKDNSQLKTRRNRAGLGKGGGGM